MRVVVSNACAMATTNSQWKPFYVYVNEHITYFRILEECLLSSWHAGHDISSPAIRRTCSNFAAAVHLVNPRKHPLYRVYRADGTYEIDEDHEFIEWGE